MYQRGLRGCVGKRRETEGLERKCRLEVCGGFGAGAGHVGVLLGGFLGTALARIYVHSLCRWEVAPTLAGRLRQRLREFFLGSLC